MARKRKRRGLGSTPEVHGERGNNAVAMVHNAVQTAMIAAKTDKDCPQAHKWMRSATGWYGHAVAHSTSGGRVDNLSLTAQTLEQAREFVTNWCPSYTRLRRKGSKVSPGVLSGLGRSKTKFLDGPDDDLKFIGGIAVGFIVLGMITKRLIPAKPPTQVAAK